MKQKHQTGTEKNIGRARSKAGPPKPRASEQPFAQEASRHPKAPTARYAGLLNQQNFNGSNNFRKGGKATKPASTERGTRK